MLKRTILNIIKYNIQSTKLPIIIGIILLLIIIRLVLLYKFKIKLVFYKELLFLVTLVYLLFLFQVVTFQDVSWSTSNYTPFKEITRYKFGGKLFYKNVVGNLIMFIPYGFLVSYYFKLRKVYLALLLSFIASLMIEYGQLLIGRVFDVDDIILNVIGGLLGFLIYKIVKFIVNKLANVLKRDYIFNIMGIVLVIGILVYIIF
ncbi:MAG: VanZ family protein [Bacilli bacterium]|nr:VanZ family protein [Bacilli bacterium]